MPRGPIEKSRSNIPAPTFTGQAKFADGTEAAPSITFASDTDTGWYRAGANKIGGTLNGIAYLGFGINGGATSAQVEIYKTNGDAFAILGAGAAPVEVRVSSDAAFSWSSTSTAFGASDLFLVRDAANVLAQRNGTNAQSFRIYNTFTDASNYERANIGWSGNIFQIGIADGVGGTPRTIKLDGATLRFDVNQTNRWNMNASGHFVAAADNTYDIGASGATRPRAGYFGTSLTAPTVTASSLFVINGIAVTGAGGGTSFQIGVEGTNLLLENRVKFTPVAAGTLMISNSGATDFTSLQFGGTTSSFPALKRSGTSLQARLADDSAFAAIAAQQVPTDATGDGAITIQPGITHISKGSAAALTLADPSAAQEGTVMIITAETAFAHTVDNSAGSGFNGGGAGSDVATFGGAVGDCIVLCAINAKWNVISLRNVTLA